MIDEINNKEKQDIELFKKFYNFASKQQNTIFNDIETEHIVEWKLNDDAKKQSIKFKYDNGTRNVIPEHLFGNNDIDKDKIIFPEFLCIGKFFLMVKKSTDGKNADIYALNALVGYDKKLDNINSCTWKIKNVTIENAKKFLSSFVDNTEPEDVNDYAKQVKNELDFKCVFNRIITGDTRNILDIVEENHKKLNVIKRFRDTYKKIYPNNGNQISFKGFDKEHVELRYDNTTCSVSNDLQTSELEQNAYYFGKYGLLMAITKSNNGKVNVFATNVNVNYDNPYGGNDEYAGLFAVYDASKEEAERFIQKLNSCNMDPVNYTIIDSQEKFEQFFQDHCKNNEIKIEDKKVDTGCCLFNLCGCGNQQNVVN